jgi:hypothetical protein
MATGSKSSPIVQLFAALQAEGIRFMVAGMSAANLQGVLASTVDVDAWIGLPARQYMRVINLCRKLNAAAQSPNKVFLSDGTPVDFIYKVSGLHNFDREYSHAKWLPFHGLMIPVLSLDRICKSKQVVGRNKDKLHILLIRQVLKLEKGAKHAGRKPKQMKPQQYRPRKRKLSRH